MTREERLSCLSRGIVEVISVVGSLLLTSIGLWVYGYSVQDSAHLAGGLLALFLSAWVGVVALGGSLLVPVWVLVRAKTACR